MDGGGAGDRREPVGGFEVGDRSEEPFLWLYERLPEAGLYRSDAYPVYQWFPQDKHKVGKGKLVARGQWLVASGRTQPPCTSHWNLATGWTKGCIRCGGAS